MKIIERKDGRLDAQVVLTLEDIKLLEGALRASIRNNTNAVNKVEAKLMLDRIKFWKGDIQ